MSNETQKDLSRRNFIKVAGVMSGGALLSACVHSEDPFALEKPAVPGADKWKMGEEKIVSSICAQCPARCGIQVRVVEGRAVKIEGNQEFPTNRGGLGPKGQSGLQLLYHPDRVKGPMHRVGARGEGRWESVSWDEAISQVGKQLRELRQKGTPEGLVLLDGLRRGPTRKLWERFLTAYGSPNRIDHLSTGEGGKVLAMNYMHGVHDLPAYDWEKTRYVLGFGSSLFESWCQTIHLTRAASYLRRGMPGHRVKIVQVSPRYSVTAAKADEWVPIQPATFGALALGIAHVLVRDKLFDEEFVRNHTFGFEDWKDGKGHSRRGFRSLLQDYTPEKVSGLTDVPVETIERLAQEMFENRPAVALADGGAAAATNGLGTAMAIHALNALLGNLEKPGGMLVQQDPPLAYWTPVATDEIAKKGLLAPRIDGAGSPDCPLGTGHIQAFPEAVLSGRPYDAQAVFLHYSNPIFSKPDGRRWMEAMKKVPLVVSFTPIMDESALWSDWILPEPTYLERWELVEPVPAVGYPILGMRVPAVKPLYDTMVSGDVVIRLAKEIGDAVETAFPWKDAKAASLELLNGLLQVKGGSISATDISELKKGLQKDGGWWAPGYSYEQWEKVFPTPSGKFEFYSQAIAARLAKVFPDPKKLEEHLVSAGVITRGDDLCLPHWEPQHSTGSEADYPFQLIPYRGIEYAEGGARHIPRLRELPSAGRMSWKECCEIHPEDASRLGIGHGDEIWVESQAGSRKLFVKLTPGMRPGMIGVALGHGQWPPDPKASEPAGSYGLVANVSDPLAGILSLQGTRVRVRKEGNNVHV